MGRLPLYKGADVQVLPDGRNTGLWYDKFCNSWQKLSNEETKINKKEWIDKVAGSRCENSVELQSFVGRRQKLIEFMDGRCFELTSFGPFVAGLGRDHPVESGFLWHHCLGVPYLPGSSLKGLALSWAKHWMSEDETLRQQIFGSEDQIGEIVFFDALPTKQPDLKADVITPHYGEYERNGEAPGDWMSPVPVPFLSVAKGANFQFALAPRRKSATPLLDTAHSWIKEGLEWLGAGARTAVGYGRFGKPKALPPPELQKREAIEATIYIDDKGRWCGRTEDGREGTVFPPTDAPKDVAVGQIRTLYVRIPKPPQFMWEKPKRKSPTG